MYNKPTINLKIGTYHKPAKVQNKTLTLKIGTYHRLAKVQGKTFDDKVDYLLSLIEARKGKFIWALDVKEYEKIRLSQLR